MRRLVASRASTAIAGAAIVAILAVMVGVAQGVTSGEAGPPSQVFMQTTDGDTDEVCLFATSENQDAMEQPLSLEAGSSVVAMFSFNVNRLDDQEMAHLGLVLTGPDAYRVVSGVWRFPGDSVFHHTAGTVTWSWSSVPTTGDYTVEVHAWIGAVTPHSPSGARGPDGDIDGCSLTTLVSAPVA